MGSEMIDSVLLGESDLALLTAMQCAPRAPWAQLGRATGLSAVTVARHWRALADTGRAWVTAAPGPSVLPSRCVAYVEVCCAPGQVAPVARHLAEDPHALTVEVTTGGTDLFITAAATDLGRLSSYLLQRVDLIPGVMGTTTRILTGLYRTGADWRLDAPPAGTALQSALRPSRDRAATEPSAVDRTLLVQLGLDGRASWAQLAAAAGVSQVTVRRRTAHLIRTGAAALRTEVAAPAAGWPVAVHLMVEVPTNLLAETARAAARHPQSRMVATVASRPSLIITAWLRRVEEVHEFERSLLDKVPQLTVSQRLVGLRTVKRMGRILDDQGRAVQAVPMDHWSDPLAYAAAPAS
ncbi:AsnC family transcriptional regulator [Flexivirga lutea]